MDNIETKYPDLHKFSKSIKINPEDLINAFEVESYYHNLIKNEKNREIRVKLYNEMYGKAHAIYNKNASYMKHETFSRKAFLFKKEFYGKSILDVGCGKGALLNTISKSYKSKELYGIDVSLLDDSIRKKMPNINFISGDITSFDLNKKFDVVYSNHVLEHMANEDLKTHITSIIKHMKRNSVLIINMPNRLFGPSDVTRIIDYSYTNKTLAQGSHFNESTYSEIIKMLKDHGFNSFKSPIPLTRVRHLFRSIRINSDIISKIEKSKILMKVLHGFKINGRCRLNFEISIIAQKNDY
tara:strand:- start:1317 stop:2207 length:891 start_codon:yes stop_codon:yes gene_type:complete